MFNSQIKAIQSLEKFRRLKQQIDQNPKKQDHCLVAFIKACFGEIFVYLYFGALVAVLAGIFTLLGTGALVFFSILAGLIYYFIYKNNKKQIQRKNQSNWLAHAPMTQVFIAQLNDFESIRIPLLIYCIYMTEIFALAYLNEPAMQLAEQILDGSFQFEQLQPHVIDSVVLAKNEYSFGLSQVAEVFCVLVTIKTLDRQVIQDLIQKLLQSFAIEQHDFIQREDLHLYQLLSAQYEVKRLN